LQTNNPATRRLRRAAWLFLLAALATASRAYAANAVTIVSPVNGTTEADFSRPIQWTSRADAQCYYLYVGSSPGAKDLVDTGETQQTSYLPGDLPADRTLYARMWTKAGGVWQYVDSTFSATSVQTAKLTFPADGATNVNVVFPVRWTRVATVQAYYLYVGTTPGAKDLVNTGETLQTSYTVGNLPVGQTLYTRLWTRAGGVWRYVDSSFTAAAAAPVTATLTYPANGSLNVDMTAPFRWTTVTNAQTYYLYVGSTPGAKDLIDTGETLQTSRVAAHLPAKTPLYVRLWTKVGGVWRFVDSSFTAAAAAPSGATLIYPANGASGIDPLSPARWTAIEGAQSYYLYVGSTPGAKDIIDSYETTQTTFPLIKAAPGRTLYARLWTKKDGAWQYVDSTFIASPLAPTFTYPKDGATGVDARQPFAWIPPSGADRHQLLVGTRPGSGDVFDSGLITATSVQVGDLPWTDALYARVLSRVNGNWRHTDIAFAPGEPDRRVTMVNPVDGEKAFDEGRPFEWSPMPLARAYRLTIGTTFGGSDLHDSGQIHVTRRFVSNLPLQPLFGRVQALIDGQWYASDFTFTVTANRTSVRLQVQDAFWATDLVRNMASTDNRAFTGTPLAAIISPRFQAVCSDFADELLHVLVEMNHPLASRRLSVALNPNSYDAHTLVELFNPSAGSWMLLDPTFDLSVRRAGPGRRSRQWATAEDVSAAMHTFQFDSIAYEFLGAAGDAFARAYYLDYPLLFNNVYHEGQLWKLGVGEPVLPYYEELTLPAVGYRMYAIRCDGSAILLINGTAAQTACSGVDGLSYIFGATSVATTDESASSGVRLYRPRRFVF
jgi:hypothetical protein